MSNFAKQTSCEFYLTAEIVIDARRLQKRITDHAEKHPVSENVRFISYLLEMTIKAAGEHETPTLVS